MKKRYWMLSFLLVLSAGSVWARSRRKRIPFTLAGIELYGSTKLSPENIRSGLQGTIDDYLKKRASMRSKAARKRIEALRDGIKEGVRELGDFGFVRFEIIERPPESGKRPLFFFFDVVDKQDMATRFPFRSEPSGDIPDGSGLIAGWKRYASLNSDILGDGVMSADRIECPALYCPQGTTNSETRSLEAKFSNEVSNYEELLTRIFREDGGGSNRAAALYLLTYLKDGSKVVRLCSSALLDPSSMVREASMTILNDIAVHHQEVLLPVNDIVRVLYYPYPQDRTRAMAVFLSISDREDYRNFLVTKAAPTLLKLLRCGYTSNHDMAHTVLSMLAADPPGPEDFDAWENWLWKERKKMTELK